MTVSPQERDELYDLLWSMEEETGSPDCVDRLDQLVRGSTDSMRLYARATRLLSDLRFGSTNSRVDATLAKLFGNDDVGSEVLSERSGDGDAQPFIPHSSAGHHGAPLLSTDPTPPMPLTFLGNVVHGSVGYFSSGWPAAYLTATVLFGLGLLIGSVTPVSQPEQVARQFSPLPSPLSPLPSVVGQITNLVDCQWADPDTAADPGAQVPLGRKYALSAGLLEISYDSGAKVILQGPVTYEVESKAGGYLSVGKLTAKLEKRSAVSGQQSEIINHKSEIPNPSPLSPLPSPLFAVRTPTAVVTDLGTEFGVEVGRDGHTTSHVFRGLVRVQVVSVGGTAEGVARLLHQNESARVDGGRDKSGADKRIIVVVPSARPADFIREIPKRTIKVFDLVDVVAGGNGFSGKRNAGIDLTTGRPTRVPPPGDHVFVGDGKYHRALGLPFVDGVFVPAGRSAAVQLDSAGHTFAEFGNFDSKTAEHVWACGAITIPPGPPLVIPTTLNGVDYASAGHGFLFMHANKGVTFDLAAIRHANPDYRLARFQSVAGSVGGMADLWVFVDGQMRFRRWQINDTHGGFDISIPIADNDCFLTLVATDGGDGIPQDWVLFGDPRLELLSDIVGPPHDEQAHSDRRKEDGDKHIERD